MAGAKIHVRGLISVRGACGFGLAGNIVVGIIGAIIGRYVFNLFNIVAGGMIGTIIMATIGAAILLFVVGLFKK